MTLLGLWEMRCRKAKADLAVARALLVQSERARTLMADQFCNLAASESATYVDLKGFIEANAALKRKLDRKRFNSAIRRLTKKQRLIFRRKKGRK